MSLRTHIITWIHMISSIMLAVYVSSNIVEANTEGEALLAIKNALHVEVNWSGSDPCQDWEGVTCLNNHVIQLHLPMKNLYGELPADIGKLSFLQNLNLSFNNIEGTFPEAISNLTNLTALTVRTNNMSGNFPRAILKLKRLSCLRLDSNLFSGSLPSDLDQLESLQYLYLGNLSLSGAIPNSIVNLTKLKVFSIWLSSINTSIPKEFGQLENLEILNLHDTGVYGTLPEEFGNLHNMKNLSLQNNLLSGDVPESWSAMTKILHLSVANNRLGGDWPSWFTNFKGRINFQCNYFTGRKPTGFPINETYRNCYDGYDDRANYCLDTVSCADFYSWHDAGGHKVAAIVGSLASFFAVVVICAACFVWFRKNNRSERANILVQGDLEGREMVLWEIPNNVQRYNLAEIRKATENFSKEHELGFGGFGRVYKAYLDSGHIAAVKRAFPAPIHEQRQFQNEVVLLSRIHHKCLVRLEGFCQEAGEQILVFEYLRNGNLNSLMWDEHRRQVLTWYKRIEIALAVAQGLDYLHSFVDPPIIHRDVKPSNILLDDFFCAKLADFGISRTTPDVARTHISTAPAGTVGYVDPQYLLQSHLTSASDVYSYGVVLLVLLTGQRAVDERRIEETNLVEWVKIKYQEGDFMSIIDPYLQKQESDSNSNEDFWYRNMKTAIELAVNCTAFEREKRPNMTTVVKTLERIFKDEDKKEGVLSFRRLMSVSTRNDQSNPREETGTAMLGTMPGR